MGKSAEASALLTEATCSVLCRPLCSWLDGACGGQGSGLRCLVEHPWFLPSAENLVVL